MAAAVLEAALAAAAGMAFHGVFAWQRLVPIVAVAAVAPVVLSAVLASRRRPFWQSLVLTGTCWLLVVSDTLFRAQAAGGYVPTTATAGAAVRALRDSWKVILTTIPPAPDRPEQLVLVHALVWAGAFAGIELGLRSRTPLVPALPAVAVLTVALLLGAGTAGSDLPLAVAMTALGGALALARSRGGGARPASLPLAASAVACVALVAGALGPNLPLAQSRQPFDPRQHVPLPPPERPDSASPLDEVSAWLSTPDTPMFTVEAASAQNWRLAVLDRFDGTTWSSAARFTATGGEVPGQPGGPGAPSIRQRITIQGLSGVWLPAADRPTSVAGARVAVDPATGVLLSLTPLHAGIRYEVASAVRDHTESELQEATPAADAEARTALTLPASTDGTPAPPQPEVLRRIAEQATAGSTFPFQQALLLADYLRANEAYDVTAPPGHSYRSLEFFLTTSHQGTSEQFATAYALLARALGLPSRVVVGFRQGRGSGGVRHVLAGDVLVWPEVDFRGPGWIPFYPTPDQERAGAGSAAVPAGESSARRAIDRRIAAASPSPASGTPGPKPPERSPAAGRGLPLERWWPAAGAGLGVLGLAYVVAIAALPAWRRRRRRRRPTQAGRVVGAWQEAVDQLRQLGLRPSRTLAAHDVADFGVVVLGAGAAGHVRPLAEAVNEAVFAPFPPAEATVEAAWRHADALAGQVAAARSWRAALRRRLDPR